MNKPWDLRERTKLFAVNVIRFCRQLPRTDETAEIATQLRRAASSVGANYWSCRRGRSTREFIAKVGVAIEEADESIFWLCLLAGAEIVEEDRTQGLRSEANELVAILTASQKTAKRRLKQEREQARRSPRRVG
jgi:four helix bundle protein